MLLSPKLDKILQEELAAGNSVNAEYKGEFANCKTLVILTRPFQIDHPGRTGVDEFVNRDSHYPMGRGYKDGECHEILLAPLN